MGARAWSVSGHVQGVWFRGFTRREAEHLGLRGSAVNQSDGTVRVEAFGDEAALAQLERVLQRGPPNAEVARVAALEPPPGSGPGGFSTG